VRTMSFCSLPQHRTCGEWPNDYVHRHQDPRSQSHRHEVANKGPKKQQTKSLTNKIQRIRAVPPSNAAKSTRSNHPVFQRNRPKSAIERTEFTAAKLPFAFRQAKFARDANPSASSIKQKSLQGLTCREKRQNLNVGGRRRLRIS